MDAEYVVKGLLPVRFSRASGLLVNSSNRKSHNPITDDGSEVAGSSLRLRK